MTRYTKPPHKKEQKKKINRKSILEHPSRWKSPFTVIPHSWSGSSVEELMRWLHRSQFPNPTCTQFIYIYNKSTTFDSTKKPKTKPTTTTYLCRSPHPRRFSICVCRSVVWSIYLFEYLWKINFYLKQKPHRFLYYIYLTRKSRKFQFFDFIRLI